MNRSNLCVSSYNGSGENLRSLFDPVASDHIDCSNNVMGLSKCDGAGGVTPNSAQRVYLKIRVP